MEYRGVFSGPAEWMRPSLPAEAGVIREVTEGAVGGERGSNELGLRPIAVVFARPAFPLAEVAVVDRLDDLATAPLARGRCCWVVLHEVKASTEISHFIFSGFNHEPSTGNPSEYRLQLGSLA